MKELLQKIGEIMGIYTKKGDRLRGNKIECNARKMSRKKKSQKTGTHKTQTITLYDNVECEIQKELSHYSKKITKDKRRILSLIFSFLFNGFDNTVQDLK